jgi:hypothetical protein
LSGFPISPGAEKDEPAEIQTFQTIKIKQIFAAGNSSFAISDGGNNLYGWGDNKTGQLGLNNEKSDKIQVPKVIDLTEKFLNEVIVYQNKQGAKSYLAQLSIPHSDVSQAMLYFHNKNLHFKELELIEEKRKLELQEKEVKKRRGVFDLRTNVIDILTNIKLADAKSLTKDIEILEAFYLSKLNNSKTKALEEKLIKHKEIIKSYANQIDYHNEKENSIGKQLKSLDNMQNRLELERIKMKKIGDENSVLERKNETMTKKQNILDIEQIISNVNSALHENKHNSLVEHLILQEQIKKIEDKLKNLNETVAVIRSVKMEATKLIDKKTEKEKIKDLGAIMNRLVSEHVDLVVKFKFFYIAE